ncbi:polysaccharide pyruvyl transferase family protein [Sutcliffiella horikoshii]|uniref:Polysaccharide pyruvyl transferase family protein n=1 Tax=Sutcliffiella horikoshii TaxID=79883 RepID=A0AA95B6N1_9BACI|nr:polysaccharide pyruvyl transferase family protein [Sutcliffiella horikoshii]TYS59868.1 polysaccharide pyruvyl transferase family protein [Sutcliffiella horikoshii]
MKNTIRKFRSPKLHPSNWSLSYKAATNPDVIIAKWSESTETKNNFGDTLNPFLFEKFTGKTPINSKNIINFSNKPIYSAIGSILDNNKDSELIVWGSGFKFENSSFKVKPKVVHAVRGPLSRKNLMRLGIDCPEVYGDPALLLPNFYNPKIEKKYKLGIIPHYVDKNHPNLKELSMKMDSSMTIIDIESGIENVIDKILSCELIASSSLHGVIVADAYNVPSISIKFSNNIAGGNFKYKDYMYSVGRKDIEPLEITKQISIDNIVNNFTNYSIDIDLDKLVEVCPFKQKL